jgi:WD40-like Beta Propeller Repeat
VRRVLYIYGTVAALLLVVGTSTAFAAWQNGAQILSVSSERLEQANSSSSNAVVSGDGRYVAFQTRATNLFAVDDPDPAGYRRIGGIFRMDLLSGALELVADGILVSEFLPSIPGAEKPSISASGRFVAFRTAQQLVPEDVNTKYDVYVRDMHIAIRSHGAFELISAKNGGGVPAGYGNGSSVLGSDVPAGAAISADGNNVLFRTQDASNLPDLPSVGVDAEQLFVRDRTAKTTTLVNRTVDGAAAGGAKISALSADGSTVVWSGTNALAQTPFLHGEPGEPFLDRFWLWRRIADGPAAETRRITGQSDVDDPDCPPDATFVQDPTTFAPCYGPLNALEGGNFSNIEDKAPAVSADGRLVAFLTAATPRPIFGSSNAFDVFVTDMTDRVSRKQGTIELTRDPPGLDQASASTIEHIGLSGDGRWLVMRTIRTNFVLASPALVSSPPATVGEAEIYVVDLLRREIERAIRAPDGTEVNRGATDAPSLSADGSVLAFTSDASNLVAGDSNSVADAFVARRLSETGQQQGSAESVAALGESGTGTEKVKKRLSVAVVRMPGGRLRLRVRVPEAGVLTARATASVPRRRAGRSRTRTLARARTRAQGAGTETVVLRLSQRYLARVAARKRISVRLLVSFSPAQRGQPPLRVDRRVSLKR